jgi:peptidyl-prolyl cis-trans isomerase SurA
MMLSTPPHCCRLVAAGLLLAGTAALVAGCRQEDPTDVGEDHQPEVAASQILVAWTGARDCPAGVVRSHAEAEERARRIAVLLRTGRGDIADIARRYSDDATAQRNGGYLGSFRRGELDPAFENLVLSLDEGQVGGPVETPYGFHIVRREPVRRVRVHHLLIAHRDAVHAPPGVTRDRDEAAQIAIALQVKISRHEADLCVLAEQFSDDPRNRRECGDLGWVEPGLLKPEVEKKVFSLAPGEVSPVVESEYGFHLFWRD